MNLAILKNYAGCDRGQIYTISNFCSYNLWAWRHDFYKYKLEVLVVLTCGLGNELLKQISILQVKFTYNGLREFTKQNFQPRPMKVLTHKPS